VSPYLLDTNIALFVLTGDPRLTSSVRAAVAVGPNVLSVATYWEIAIKAMRGRLDVGDPRTWWQHALQQLAATPLPIRPEHIASLCLLPPIHQDPFDRILIAQAISQGFTLLTADQEIAQYSSAGFSLTT
jgi:PIN domain nuclease of toxin-antitoxin system